MNAATSPVSRDAYGALLVMIAAPALVPGLGALAAPFAGLAGLALGAQLAIGRRIPWVPSRVRAWVTTAPMGPRMSLWIQKRLQPFLRLPSPGFPRVLAGLTVAWSSLLLVLPLAFVPFSNMAPALALGLVGLGLAARKSLFGWLGAALSGGYTALLILVGEAVLLAGKALLENLS
ncbi:MAG: exopolysaccharide biosynthesis protein [Acidobacteria bacterium]|nr:exopolysaccharide biosynthesis protein [Acidobacteriota bacterium]